MRLVEINDKYRKQYNTSYILEIRIITRLSKNFKTDDLCKGDSWIGKILNTRFRNTHSTTSYVFENATFN